MGLPTFGALHHVATLTTSATHREAEQDGDHEGDREGGGHGCSGVSALPRAVVTPGLPARTTPRPGPSSPGSPGSAGRAGAHGAEGPVRATSLGINQTGS